MTKDQVISLYVLANGWNPEGWPNTVSELQRFANLIEDQARINEREACAKVCDAKAMHCETKAQEAIKNGEHDEVSAIRSTAWQISVCAADIRARGNT